MAITATVYRPHRNPEVLNSAQRSLLSITLGKQLTAHTRTVCDYLGVKEADLLHADAHVAIWGMSNAADYENMEQNEEAEKAVYGLTGEQSELVGPILIIVHE